jgi:hypothetical protein
MSIICKAETPWRCEHAGPSTGLVDLGAAARVVDIAGLYLGRPGRVLALAVERRRDQETQLPPTLPMELGVSDLLDELDAAMSLPVLRYSCEGRTLAYQNFLSEVDRAVPASLDVHLICLSRAAQPVRFSASYAETEQLWGDKVIHCLGHRAARRLRRRTGEITFLLRKWIDTRTLQESNFTWVCSSYNKAASQDFGLGTS